MIHLEAFRLVGGPCDGEIAELPPDGFDFTWRCTPSFTYAEYKRDGFVFRFAGREISAADLAALVTEHGDEVTLHADSREYER